MVTRKFLFFSLSKREHPPPMSQYFFASNFNHPLHLTVLPGCYDISKVRKKIKLYLFPGQRGRDANERARPGQRRSILKRIFVSFKMVNDYEQVLPEDWDAFLQEDAALDYVRQIVNCFDESALELAPRDKGLLPQIGGRDRTHRPDYRK